MELPYNPDVRELVAGKRRWSSPPKRDDALYGFRNWHERGFLPHRDEPGLTQFVTFNLSDSYPRTLRTEWKELEAYLDKGRGECLLRNPYIGRLVDEAFLFYHSKRYDLLAWVVMPNHVHALFKVGNMPLSKIIRDLKGYTAREANKLLHRRGQFWAEDYFDTYMRDTQHILKARRYIENNPAKAFLVRDPKEWPWSSSRFRTEDGSLRF